MHKISCFLAASSFLLLGVGQAFASPVGPDQIRRGCTQINSASMSPASDEAATIDFLNQSDHDIYVIWIDFEGGQKVYHALAPGQSASQGTYTGHLWLIADKDGSCLGAFGVTQSQEVVIR